MQFLLPGLIVAGVVIVGSLAMYRLYQKRNRVIDNFITQTEDDDDYFAVKTMTTKANNNNLDKPGARSVLSSLGFDAIDELLPQKSQTQDLKRNATPSDQSIDAKKTRATDSLGANKKNTIITLYVMAEENSKFYGYDLQQILLASGLRFGSMGIFHRFQDLQGQGEILFSVASATEPGVFDMNNMGAFSCLGLTLFLQADTANNPLANFELMLGTARYLTSELEGDLLDSERQILNNAKVKAYREQIRNAVSD